MSQIHKTAIIEPGAKIGKNVIIGPYCVVGPNVNLADEVTLKSHVVVDGRTTIGSGTVVYPFASLGMAPQDLKYEGEDAELIIGSNNIIREHVTMNIGTAGDLMKTIVGNNCLFMMSSHVAHDCVVGDNVILANNATLGGHVRLGNFVILGGLSAVHQFVKIGEYSMIGGLSGVVRDLAPYSMVIPDYPSLSGINAVGLKRGGFSPEEIRNIKKAYDMLFDDSRTLSESVAKLEEVFAGDKAIERIVAFFKNESSRGFLTPRNYHGKIKS